MIRGILIFPAFALLFAGLIFVQMVNFLTTRSVYHRIEDDSHRDSSRSTSAAAPRSCASSLKWLASLRLLPIKMSYRKT